MHIDPILLLDYTIWANDRVLDGARQLPPDVLHAPIRAGWESPLGVLVHMLAAERIWLSRCQGDSPTSLLSQDDLPTLDGLAAAWSSLRAELRAFLVAEGDTGREIVYRTTRGVEHRQPLWQILLHLFNHQTEHRSQVALVLAQHGIDTGGLDVIWYVRQG